MIHESEIMDKALEHVSPYRVHSAAEDFFKAQGAMRSLYRVYRQAAARRALGKYSVALKGCPQTPCLRAVDAQPYGQYAFRTNARVFRGFAGN